MRAFIDWLLKRVTVQLDDGLHKKAKLYAVENDCSMNDLFVEAIKNYLDEQKKEEMSGEA